MRVVIQTAPVLVNSFHPTQVYLLFMRLSVWVDLIELVRHKHERSHKSFFTNRGGSAAQADPAHNRSPHNHTHSPYMQWWRWWFYNHTCSINMSYAVSFIYHIMQNIQRKMLCQDRSCSRINNKIILFPTLLYLSRHSNPPCWFSLTSYGTTHQHFGFGTTFTVQLRCVLQTKEKSLRSR